ncbi:sigma factor [Pseudonocardia lacus]|uniref:sigma factor n=1 Tax=Pseudonocardia lacus TaxID=2835865 RepID=UPI0027E28654|nr:sigma factor [Pseudonocardia lacus]
MAHARSRSARPPGLAGEAVVRGVWEEHGGAALAYARWLTHDGAAAEDVVQEAWSGRGCTRRAW